ncbi:MAG: S49 family peptidase [Thiolinea sp.]
MAAQINYPHLASMVFNTPLLCTTQLRDAVHQAILPRLLGGGVNVNLPDLAKVDALAPGVDEYDAKRVEYSTYHGVAVLPVHGILTVRRGGIDAECREISSYEKTSALLDAALNDSSVEHVVLDMNTPGGAAVGCFDFAEKVYQARQQKPITAIVNYNAYSAGYMIASAASEIIVSATSGVGSIGVIASHVDMSKALDQAGLKVTTFYRGYRKNDLSPYEEVSEEAAAVLNQELDELYALFVESVARNRGLSTQAVIDTQAGTYRGQQAVDIGLADKLMYPQDAVNSIAQAIADRKLEERSSRGSGKRIGAQAALMKMQAQL